MSPEKIEGDMGGHVLLIIIYSLLIWILYQDSVLHLALITTTPYHDLARHDITSTSERMKCGNSSSCMGETYKHLGPSKVYIGYAVDWDWERFCCRWRCQCHASKCQMCKLILALALVLHYSIENERMDAYWLCLKMISISFPFISKPIKLD